MSVEAIGLTNMTQLACRASRPSLCRRGRKPVEGEGVREEFSSEWPSPPGQCYNCIAVLSSHRLYPESSLYKGKNLWHDHKERKKRFSYLGQGRVAIRLPRVE